MKVDVLDFSLPRRNNFTDNDQQLVLEVTVEIVARNTEESLGTIFIVGRFIKSRLPDFLKVLNLLLLLDENCTGMLQLIDFSLSSCLVNT